MAAFVQSASRPALRPAPQICLAETIADPFLPKACVNLTESDKSSQKVGDKQRNKDLSKTKLCAYFLQGKCGLGSNCQFAHSTSEVRDVPNLAKTQLCTAFMKGRCTKQNCNYAHGEAELVMPPSYKKKVCAWFKQGQCRNGVNCGFIHDFSQSVVEAKALKQSQQRLLQNNFEYDYEASTEVPSSPSQVESDITLKSSGPIPQENLFRMMAGRGSAPVQQQVKSMSLAIGDLQAMLSQLHGRRRAASSTPEGQALQKQMDDMQQSIQLLSKQCEVMETRLPANPQPALQVTQPAFIESCSNAPAAQPPRNHDVATRPPRDHQAGVRRRDKKAAADGTSHAITSTTTLPPSPPVKVRPTTQSQIVKSSKLPYQFGMREGLCVVVFALMIMIELVHFR